MSVRCGDMVSVTGVTDPELVQKVLEFAKNLAEDASWTKEMVKALCDQVGRVPFPRLLQVEHLPGQGTVLLRVVTEEGPGVTELNYPKRSSRCSFNVMPVVKAEGMKLPEGMCLEVPVAFVLDGDVLKVEAKLSKGVQRQTRGQDDEETEAEGTEHEEKGDEQS